jgi:hypothetical protein
MANPDGTTMTMVLSGVTMFIITAFLFNNSDSPSFYLQLYLGVPIIAYVLSIIANTISRFSACGNLDIKILSSGIPTIIAIYIALGISYFDSCRTPIASVVAPFFVNSAKQASNVANNIQPGAPNAPNPPTSDSCCTKTITLQMLETNPVAKGLSYAFYLFFAMLFGITAGSATATNC